MDRKFAKLNLIPGAKLILLPSFQGECKLHTATLRSKFMRVTLGSRATAVIVSQPVPDCY
eukprot:1073332-Rhodomonas_salina.1